MGKEMNFDKVDFSGLKLDNATSVSKTCIRPVMQNHANEVKISSDEARESVKVFGEMKRKSDSYGD